MADRKLVQAQIEEGRSVAVVYHGGHVGDKLSEMLKKEGLKVVKVTGETMFPLLEKPRYVFFFISEADSESSLFQDWKDALATVIRNDSKLFLCLAGASLETHGELLSRAKEEKVSFNEVEMIGEFLGDDLILAIDKIIKLAFASDKNSGHLRLVGKINKEAQAVKKLYQKPIKHNDYWEEFLKSSKKKPQRWSQFLSIVSIAVLILFLPLFVSLVITLWGAGQLRESTKKLQAGEFQEAAVFASDASNSLDLALVVMGKWQPIWETIGMGIPTRRYSDLLSVGKLSADGLSHGAKLAEKAYKLAKTTMGNGQGGSSAISDISEIRSELTAIDGNLGLMEAQTTHLSDALSRVSSFFGVSPDGVSRGIAELSQVRELVSRINLFLGVLPEIIGQNSDGKKTYLVVLQNNSELRPSGGFIGSYGIITFEKGRILDFKINDVYSADGQLRGRIQPPDEILHFLGQPFWYMRDANWAADWPLTSKRLEWFLEKETGEKVDGVWAITLPFVQKVLAATGPIAISDLSETVSASDFFHKAEYASEINFFPGSTQKKDFLGATAQAILDKITGGGSLDWVGLGHGLGKALAEKDIQLYFNSEQVQKVVQTIGWGGSIVTGGCGDAGTNCLMIVDANLGANKSNYFVKRNVVVNMSVGKGGEMENRVVVSYQNDSPNMTWPGGTYKNYVRFLVPVDSQLVGFDLGDGRKPRVSEILTAEAIKTTPAEQFLVYKNFELSSKSLGASGSAHLSFGTYFEVPVGESRNISFSYRPGYKMDFKQKEPAWGMMLLRQPGSGADDLSVVLDFPSFLQPIESGKDFSKMLVFPGKVAYNSDWLTDKNLKVNFKTYAGN